MFKNLRSNFRNKLLAMLCIAALAVTMPVSLSANTGNPAAAFTFVSVSQSTVNAGQPVTFTLSTTGANFVFANIAGTNVPAVETQTLGNQTTWSLTVTPMQSQTILIYANTIQAMEGSSVISFPITVNAAGMMDQQVQQGGFQHTPQVGAHRIYSIEEITATEPNSVILRIVTDANAGAVWMGPEATGSYRQATRVSQSGSQSTWEMRYRPTHFRAHNVTISANARYELGPTVVSQNFSVNLTAPYVPTARPAITRITPNSVIVDRRDRTDVSIRTNLDARYVWAEVDGSRINARHSTASATVRNWTLDFRPDRSQTVRVYANNTDSPTGAVTETFRVTVRDVENPRIHEVDIRDEFSIRVNRRVVVEIRTNADVEHVWATLDGSRVGNARRDSHRSSLWILEFDPRNTGNQNLRIYANTRESSTGADTRSRNIFVDW